MICALLLGREGSSGFPGKNIYPVLGLPLAAYPMMAANACPSIDQLYISTDSPALVELGRSLGAEIIERPAYLASKEALGEHAYVHGYQVICERLARKNETLELLVLLFANAATITPYIIEEGIAALRSQPQIDSAVTVSCYNMWSPLRARRINAEGLLDPFVPLETFGDPKTMNCDRDSQGNVWFADMGVSIVRPRCLERLEEGLLPQKWMGQKIYPLQQWGGHDVDEPWQIPALEAWLQAHAADKLFKIRRHKWSQFYNSQRAALSMLSLGPESRVIDIGNDPGGFGLALYERFGVESYTALVSDESQAKEVMLINPGATVITKFPTIPNTNAKGAFDLVAALGIEDDPDFLETTIHKAFEQLAPGGSLVFDMRLTDSETVCDENLAYQYIPTGSGKIKKHLYVVRNIRNLMDVLKKLPASRISGYGHSSISPSTVHSSLRIICFGAFVVTRAHSDNPTQPAEIDLKLPDYLLTHL